MSNHQTENQSFLLCILTKCLCRVCFVSSGCWFLFFLRRVAASCPLCKPAFLAWFPLQRRASVFGPARVRFRHIAGIFCTARSFVKFCAHLGFSNERFLLDSLAAASFSSRANSAPQSFGVRTRSGLFVDVVIFYAKQELSLKNWFTSGFWNAFCFCIPSLRARKLEFCVFNFLVHSSST